MLKNNNLAPNSNDDGISKQVPQGNNGEEIKENRRVEEISATIRDSYQANAKELKGPELEDFEKQVVFIYLEH